MAGQRPASPPAGGTGPRPPVRAAIGLGANLGDAPGRLRDALLRIDALAGTRLLASSRLWRSAPVEANGPDFHNAVALVETGLDAFTLLAGLQRIEAEAGRERPYRNAPRTLDLDLLLYGQGRIDAPPRLVVPHPRMAERAFVLRPLLEVAPDATIPGVGPAADRLGALAGQRADPVPGSREPACRPRPPTR
ncbi:MAG: 2-amino-4-hydroxy-6-hydroxymethyldihydropteridine diphosphokinase [Burkholderiaceae bacterium]